MTLLDEIEKVERIAPYSMPLVRGADGKMYVCVELLQEGASEENKITSTMQTIAQMDDDEKYKPITDAQKLAARDRALERLRARAVVPDFYVEDDYGADDSEDPELMDELEYEHDTTCEAVFTSFYVIRFLKIVAKVPEDLVGFLEKKGAEDA